MRLKGKTAIITGAAKGIGSAAAKLFAAEGARVALFDIDIEGLRETANEIDSNARCLSLRTDITSEAEVAESTRKVVEEFSKIDILFNNAAYNRGFKTALETSEEEWDRELNVTLKGAFFCSKQVLPHMLRQGGGSIIKTASYLAFTAYPGYAAYCAAKGGLLQLARSLAVDYSAQGVRVNVICPGPVDTPALDTIRKDPEFMQRVKDLTLLGRIARPEEIARVALFLASDESSYMTGSVVVVDGGATARLG